MDGLLGVYSNDKIYMRTIDKGRDHTGTWYWHRYTAAKGLCSSSVFVIIANLTEEKHWIFASRKLSAFGSRQEINMRAIAFSNSANWAGHVFVHTTYSMELVHGFLQAGRSRRQISSVSNLCVAQHVIKCSKNDE